MPRKYSEEDFNKNFWERIDKTSDPQGCWLWTGSKTFTKYGQVRWNNKTCRTHIVAYLLTGHTISEGLDLAHSEHCKGKRHCCNPNHLEPKTRSENMLDCHRDGTMALAKLTKEHIIAIRARETENHYKLANEYGVHQTTISKIIRKDIWKHI